MWWWVWVVTVNNYLQRSVLILSQDGIVGLHVVFLQQGLVHRSGNV